MRAARPDQEWQAARAGSGRVRESPAQGTPQRPWLARAADLWLGVLALAFAALSAHILFGAGGAATDKAFDDGVYNAIMLGAPVGLLARALSSPRGRNARLLIGCGLLTWAFGDLYYTIYFAGLENPPFPSIADALYLSYYPFMYVGLGLLIRARFRGIGAASWLDGLIAGLGIAAVAAGVLLDRILASTGGSLATVATNLAYPMGDLLLLLMVVTAIGLTGWRPERKWALLALALLVSVSADTTYLFQIASGTYQEGAWLELLWPLSSLLLVSALARPLPARRRSALRLDRWRTIAVPAVGAVAAVGVLFVDHGSVRVNDPARYLAVATLVAAAVRVALAFRASMHSREESRMHALTDPLTGLGNRRMLAEDLGTVTQDASEAEPRLLVMYDLNGFKLYNDTFGHPAGDSLLASLGRKLGAAVAAHQGTAYRMGGDEFCALLKAAPADAESLAAATRAALTESGQGFHIDAAYGTALLPQEADTPEGALQLVDRRLYATKESRPVGVQRQLRGVLLQALGEREPSMLSHLDGVASLALAVGKRMGLMAEDLDVLVRAAEMHDVGKVAIPDAVLDKPGPLDEQEWAFMRRHTILGERILAAAPALVPVAKLVRSSHERWDGGGYPDALLGEEIPLGSRIICVCDAYDAMISERPYTEARSSAQALAELTRCAGTQFDPAVVTALRQVLADRRGQRDPVGAAPIARGPAPTAPARERAQEPAAREQPTRAALAVADQPAASGPAGDRAGSGLR